MSHAQKDPTGVMMRLVWKLVQTEMIMGTPPTQADMKLIAVLRRETDKKIADFYEANPHLKPGGVGPLTRMGKFVQTLEQFRNAEKTYWSSRTKDNFQLMHSYFSIIGNDLDSYFNQFPDQSPEDRKKMLQPALFA